MKKSIEEIWKEGFIKDDALVAPKINDLYNLKSKHLVERFTRMGKRNIYAILVGGIVFMLLSFVVGVPFFGIFLMLLLGSIAIVAKNQSKGLKQIDKTTDSYEYLKAFDLWLKNAIAEYSRMYRFIYPAIFAIFMLGVVFSDLQATSLFDKIMNDPDTLMINGLPVLWIGFCLAFLLLVSAFSGKIYKLDILTVYGGIFKKLEELISDMEELRNDPTSQ